MERLTVKNRDFSQMITPEMWNKLWEYENTELTPKEVWKLKQYSSDLQELAYTDPLTKAHNRHWLNEQDLTENEYYISVVDLNGLKAINDTQGHLAGDNAIKELAEFLKGFGEVIRMGGDEFVVLSKELHSELSGRFESYCSATVHKIKGMDLESAYDSADREMMKYKKEMVF